MRPFQTGLAALGLLALGATAPARAVPVTFTATGNSDIVGSLTFADGAFNGSSLQNVPNSLITALSLTVFGHVFSLADVQTSHGTYVDSSGAAPKIVNGDGSLARMFDPTNETIAFFADGSDSLPLDGDATMELAHGNVGTGTRYFVTWVSDVEAASAPEPATLALIGLGLAGIGLARRRRSRV